MTIRSRHRLALEAHLKRAVEADRPAGTALPAPGGWPRDVAGGRSPAALAPSEVRSRFSAGIPPHRRGQRPDPPDRRMGARRRLPPVAGVGAGRPGPRPAGGEPLQPTVPGPKAERAPSGGGVPGPQRPRRPLAGAGDPRKLPDAGPGHARAAPGPGGHGSGTGDRRHPQPALAAGLAERGDHSRGKALHLEGLGPSLGDRDLRRRGPLAGGIREPLQRPAAERS